MKAEGLLQKAKIQTALWLPWDVVGACSLYPQVNIPKGNGRINPLYLRKHPLIFHR